MRNNGFSLLEVLVASVIMLLGVTGYTALQSQYIRLDNSLNMRQHALYLAQEKLQDLQHFTALHSDPETLAYNDIITNGGGQIGAGDVQVALSALPGHEMLFSRYWQVTNSYFVDTDNNGTPDSWLVQGSLSLPAILPVIAPQKHVLLTVAWQGYQGEELEVTLSSYISPISIATGAHINNPGLGTQTRPEVKFTPVPSADNLTLALTSGQVMQATSPQVLLKGENVTVNFSHTNFVEHSPIRQQQQQKQDRLMVGCQCALKIHEQGLTPAMITLDGGRQIVTPGQWTTKWTGQPVNAEQPAQCVQCCRDHHDTDAMVTADTYYRTEQGMAHKHYNRSPEGIYSQALNKGDEYQEVCHIKLYDGFYHLFADLQLVALTELPQDHLEQEHERNAYTQFVERKIAASLSGENQLVELSPRVLVAHLAAYQFVAHGLYLERLKSVDRASLVNLITQDDRDWLALTPFFDLNVTLLANWASSNEAVASVTQQVLQNIEDPWQDYYASYSRGLVQGLSSGNSQISATLASGNAGLVGGYPLSPLDAAQVKKGDGVSLTIGP
ncbi:MAG: prepilin-type N-terminal cleavage/methylation domain-containing protein [Paraglaciecola sp.]|jgi:prepilin-type N-terminal cleavage/methylation domain-containing protein